MENSKNRVIKFRAWDGEEMDYEPKVWGDSAYGDPIGTDINKLVKEYVGVLMQFTGLKDKNGKEIYEGDILHLDSWTDNQQVVFIEGAFCLAGKNSRFTADIYYIHHAGIPQASVIGNIYENPELLK